MHTAIAGTTPLISTARKKPQVSNSPGRFWQPPSYVDGWQNYSRVGGLPSWIQSGLYLACPDCCRTMFFVMQLDSRIPLDDGSLMQWMNGGMLYTFWCDHCRISGHYSQYS